MNPNRVAEIYKELENIVLAIPDFSTPDEITSSIFKCRERINQVEKLAIEINKEIAHNRRELLSKRKERQVKFNCFMKDNDEVKKGKSGLDRQAIAESLLSQIDGEIIDLESEMVDLKYLGDAIELRVSNLNKTNSDVRLAWSVMQNATYVAKDVLPKETAISAEDLESLDLAVKTTKKVDPILTAKDLSKTVEKIEDEESFNPEVIVDLIDTTNEVIDEPLSLVDIAKTPKVEIKEVLSEVIVNKKDAPKEIETKKESPKKETKKEEFTEDFITTSSVKSMSDDIDIDRFIADL